MEAIRIKPKRHELNALLIMAALLCAAALAFPQAALPAAVLLPLCLCPLADKPLKYWAFSFCAAPAFSCLLRGWNPLFSLSLLLCTGLPMAVTLRKGAKSNLREEFCLYSAATAAGLCAALTAAGTVFGKSVPEGITDWLIGRIDSSGERGMILAQLASVGLAGIPSEFANASLAEFTTNSGLIGQLYLSLRANLNALQYQLGPAAAVHGVLLTGLFTALRVARFHGGMLFVNKARKEVPVVAMPPGFRQLIFPRELLLLLALLRLAAVFLTSSGAVFPQMLGEVFTAAFRCVFCLQGAAVLIHGLCGGPDDSAFPAGLLSAFLYLCFPTVLLLVGILDCFFHFRTAKKSSEKDEGGL